MSKHRKREIIYPFLLKAGSYANDNFWRFVFEDLSYGSCPYGVFLYKGNLCSNMKGKEFSYKLCPDKPSQDLFNDIYGLLKNKANILSDKDKLSEREKTNRSRLNDLDKKEDGWQSVKKKMIRDTLVEQYVLNNTHLFHLTLNVAKQLLSFIIIGLMFKTIISNDIHYDNGYIKAINGFHYSPSLVLVTKKIFSNDFTSTELDIIACERKKKNSYRSQQPRLMSELWSVYLSDLLV